MAAKFNAKEFRKLNRDSFVRSIEDFQNDLKPLTLVIQANTLPLLESIFTFSQLKRSTRIENVVKNEDDGALELLRGLLNTTTLIFMIDVRTSIKIEDKLCSTITELALDQVNIILPSYLNATYQDDKVKDYLHYLFPTNVHLVKWHMFPVDYLDSHTLNCKLLKNDEGMNMYFPSKTNLCNATRGILLDNLAGVVISLLEKEGITITKSIAFGENSKRLIDTIKQRLKIRDSSTKRFIRNAMYGKRKCGERNDIIVFERSIDTLTPMMTDLTYSGILSEVGNTYAVSKDDDIWSELKYLNFGAVGLKLNTIAKDLQTKYQSRHEANTISEIKEFVDGLGDLQSRQNMLKDHTAQSSDLMEVLTKNDFKERLDFEQEVYSNSLDHKTVIDKIIEQMCFEPDESSILRLCCLFSQARNGLREKEYSVLKQELIDSFGNDMFFKLAALEKYNLFNAKDSKNASKNYQSISKAFDTLPDVDIDPSKPLDMNYAYSGTVPIIVRILQSLFDRGIFVRNNSSILQTFVHSKVPTLSKLETLLEDLNIPADEDDWVNVDGKVIGDTKDSPDLTIVVFIGGVTYGELSTIDYLGKKLQNKSMKKEFVIITDGIITGNALV